MEKKSFRKLLIFTGVSLLAVGMIATTCNAQWWTSTSSTSSSTTSSTTSSGWWSSTSSTSSSTTSTSSSTSSSSTSTSSSSTTSTSSTSSSSSSSGSVADNIVCPSGNQAAGNYTYNINVNGTSRSYRLHIPSGLSTPAAVVISLHGITSSASSQQSGSGWDTTSNNNRTFVVAYPDGIGAAWNVGPFNNNVDDAGFMTAIVNDVSRRVRIAPNKIFISGTSLGGGFSHKMACKRADYFAGAAPVVFHLWSSPTDVADCSPAKPITVLEYAGRNDMLVRYSGGTSSVNGGTMTHLSATASFQKWASLNGCSGNPVTVWSSGLNYNNKQYQSCSGGVIVGLASLSCGHGYCTDTTFGLPSDDAWKVFKTKTRSGRKADACQ